jgi:methionyl-tRNA synthetase
VKWGIPVPNNPAHTIYVWIDALTNYLTVLGGPEAVAKSEGKGVFWASAHHLIAKDILRFHAVYWPAMLMSAGLPCPQKILCHGYLTVKGQKISKSIPATKVDPMDIANELGVDPLRYFLMREYTFGGDGDFTYEALLQRYESDLGNDLGNLLNRTVSMARQYLGGVVPARAESEPVSLGEPSRELIEVGKRAWVHAAQVNGWADFSPSTALEHAWSLARRANRYIEETKPWARNKAAAQGNPDASAEVAEILANLCEALRRVAILIAPAIPATAEAILAQLGLPPLNPPLEAERLMTPASSRKAAWRIDEIDSEEQCWHWEPGTPLGEPKPLFPRLDPERKASLLDRWTGEAADAAAAAIPGTKNSKDSQRSSPTTKAESPASAPVTPIAATAAGSVSPSLPIPDAPGAAAPAPIAIEDFAKIELRAAKVLTAERVPKTEKLLKLTLDLGTEQRTVVSGIAAAYSPEDMVGRTVIYLANLKPAKIRGVISQGMILAAGDHDVLALSALDREVPPGTLIR